MESWDGNLCGNLWNVSVAGKWLLFASGVQAVLYSFVFVDDQHDEL